MPWERLPRWTERLEERHPGVVWTFTESVARAEAPDGAWVRFDIPFGPLGDATMSGLVNHLRQPRELGVLLVRRGGFAIAHVRDNQVATAKIGRRHVQGRTKAGGWSQQRFARRRDNQARQAFDAAADHAAAILAPVASGLSVLALGGDRAAVEHVLSDARLRTLNDLPRHWVQVTTDPRREAVAAAVKDARSVVMEIVDPTWTA